MIPKDLLLINQITNRLPKHLLVFKKSRQRGFIQSLMERTLGGVQGILQVRERKDCRSQRVKDTTRKLTESTNLDSQGLTETELITREPTWIQFRHSVCTYATVVQLGPLARLLTTVTKPVSDTSTGFWDPTPILGHLAQP